MELELSRSILQLRGYTVYQRKYGYGRREKLQWVYIDHSKPTDKTNRPRVVIDYTTNEGYGKLRDWYDGWDEDKRLKFMAYLLGGLHLGGQVNMILHAFHRDKLAPLMLEFLKQEQS